MLRARTTAGGGLLEGEVVLVEYIVSSSPPRPPRTGPLTGRPCAGGPAKEGWALNTYRIMLSVHRAKSLCHSPSYRPPPRC